MNSNNRRRNNPRQAPRDPRQAPRDNADNAARNNNEPRKKIGFKRVEELVAKEPDSVVLALNDVKFGFEDYMKAESMGDDLVKLLVNVLNKAFECNAMQVQINKLIDQLVNSTFLNELVYTAIEASRDKFTGGYDITFIKNAMSMCSFILRVNPARLISLEKIIERIELVVRLRIREKELMVEFDDKIDRLRLEIQEQKRKNIAANNTQVKKVKPFFVVSHEQMDPPEKITNLSILPTLEEIDGSRQPFLRRNVVQGAYKSVEHYLDVHFRLLREDFLQPLRDGISEFKKIIQDHKAKANAAIDINELSKKAAHIDGLRAYFNVKFTTNNCTDNGLTFLLQLDIEKCKNIKWEYSKRLLFGSLICLSNDFFEQSFILAVICERDVEALKKGIIKVRIEEENGNVIDKAFLLNDKSSYVMFETTAYFEAYRHVLFALRTLSNARDDDFPFKKHIIESKNENMEPPEYLTNAYIDLRTLVDHKKVIAVDGSYTFNQSSSYARQCSLYDRGRWPTPEQMNLDISQYEAINIALSQKIALIQGPPGTGKTFIGVKIMQLLLHNKDLWCNQAYSRKRPILMICYTNHALDQFLELCVNECKIRQGVVRIGGRSTNKNLEPFLLRNIKQRFRDERTFDKEIFYQSRDESRKLRDLQTQMNIELGMIEISNVGILKRSLLIEFMHEMYTSQLSSDVDLLEWLGFSISEFVNNQENVVVRTTTATEGTGDVVQAMEVEEEEEDEEDDDNNERMLDEDFNFTSNNKSSNVTNSTVAMSLDTHSNIILTEDDVIGCYDKDANDGWKTVGKNDSNNSIRKLFKKIVKNTTAKDVLTNDLWRLDYDIRMCLYTFWVSQYRQKYNQRVDIIKNAYNISLTTLSELRMQEDRVVMQNSDIIAMTTTGSARYHKILKDIGPRIVIVEEAAEVFEAHLVTSLSKHCEHLILIGDHVQLKPKPNVYKLEKDYHLDVSLFERLIKNKLNYATLRCQHRMKPEISLLMKHFYDIEIIDHESVKNRPNIIGVKQNVVFMHHRHAEQNYDEGKGKVNPFEAAYLIKLAGFLVRQHYAATQITILTTYLGQFFRIRNELKKEKELKGIRVCTVDNYQGEENDIVLLSLVRSNQENKMGFLKIENRICVALSRARNGLFCIGNFELLANSKTKWVSIVQTLREKGYLSNGVMLSCGYHPNKDLLALQSADFDKRPEGGCDSRCEFRLDCGHTCSYFCHLYDPNHLTIQCRKECAKTRRCGHLCKKQCGHKKDCSEFECLVKLEKQLPCGHKQMMPCFKDPATEKCSSKCEKKFECGHQCSKKCFERPCEPCTTLVDRNALCKHDKTIVKVPCRTESWKLQEFCNKKCSTELSCEHLCKSICGNCFGGRIHAPCDENCNRVLVCGHKCMTKCAKSCRPCTKKCENRCPHSKCHLLCSIPCVACKEPCTWKCAHEKCTKLCHEICDRKPCERPCDKKLKKCGHACIGYCGETCPKLCRICDKDTVTEIFFGTEDDPEARFVLLEDCQHVVEAEGMTGWMESQFGENKTEDASSNAVKLPECPKCKTPIRRNLRYSTYVKRQLDLIEKVKEKYSGSKTQIEIAKGELARYLKENKDKTQAEFLDKYSETVNQLLDKKSLTSVDIVGLRNKWTLYYKLIDIEKNNQGAVESAASLRCLQYEVNKIKAVLFQDMKFFSQQFEEEISYEIQRIDRLYQLFKCSENLYPRMKEPIVKSSFEHLVKLDYLLNSKIQPYKAINEQVKSLFEKIRPFLSGLQITEQEKADILKAMGLSKGHWYKCKNGHVYCITECGGAMQESTCPDCGVRIGGTNHALVADNQVATEMDGARYAAWSEQANLQNFNLDDLA